MAVALSAGFALLGALAPVAALALALAAPAGCASAPARAWTGAQAYADGTAALERGDLERAIARLEAASTLVPHASEIRNHLGLAYWAAGRPEAARTAFTRALELDCENDVAQANLARLEALAGADSASTSPHGREAVGGAAHGRR